MNSPALYRPGTLIRDFHETPSNYYRSPGVHWTPFTKLDALVPKTAAPAVRRKRPNPVQTPLFHDVSAITSAGAAAVPVLSPSTMVRPVGRPISQRQTNLPHKKYTLEHGVTTEVPARTATFAKLSAAGVLLCLALLWSLVVYGPKSEVPVTKPAVSSGSAHHTTITPAPAAATSNPVAATSTAPAAIVSRSYSSGLGSGSSSSGTGSGSGSTTTTGGMGGGDSSGTTTTGGDTGSGGDTGTGSGTTGSDGGDNGTGSGSGSTTDPVTVTVPPVTVDTGDGSVTVDTSGVSASI